MGGGGGAAEAVSDFCKETIATYSHRVSNDAVYNWCVVPNSSFDAILFVCIALAIGCVLLGKFSTTLVLVAGGVLMAIATPFNLGRISNAIAWWLGISPYQLFFYIFLPPLLLEAAVRINFFQFKKVVFQVITLAYMVVILASALMIPIFLYVFDLKRYGWNWAAAAMYGAMVASTDAVAIISTMKTSGASSRLRVILEGESLLNDASSFTLFHIYLEKVEELAEGHGMDESTAHLIGNIAKKIVWMAVGGSLVGLAFGIALHRILAWLRTKDAHVEQQVALTLAVGYLAFYVAENPTHVSGVVSVAAFGLYGAYTQKWGMSRKVEESGAFDAFWDTICYAMNAIVFFYSGVSCCNFFWRSIRDLRDVGEEGALLRALWMLPFVYLTMFILRFLLTLMFQPLLRLANQALKWNEVGFIAAAGVRGSVSLILAQAVITDLQSRDLDKESQVVRSQIVFWTAGFVLLTLLINGPMLPFFLKFFRLNNIHKRVLQRRAHAVKALEETTEMALDDLRQDEDEMLTSVDWGAVEEYADVTARLHSFFKPDEPSPYRPSIFQRFLSTCCACLPSVKQSSGTSQISNSPPGSPSKRVQSSPRFSQANLNEPKLTSTALSTGQWDTMDKHLGRASNSRIAAYSVGDGRTALSRTSEERHSVHGSHHDSRPLARNSPLLATTSLKPYFNPIQTDLDFLMDEVPFAHASPHPITRKSSGFKFDEMHDASTKTAGDRSVSRRKSEGTEVTAMQSDASNLDDQAPVVKRVQLVTSMSTNKSTNSFTSENSSQPTGNSSPRSRNTPSLATLSNSARAAYEPTVTFAPPGSAGGLPPVPSNRSRLSTGTVAVASDDKIFGRVPPGLQKPPGGQGLQQLKSARQSGTMSLARASELLGAGESGDGSGQRSPRSSSKVQGSEGTGDEESGNVERTPSEEMYDDELINMRTSLLAGVRQYCQTKRLEGLLSSKALRTIETALESALEQAEEPLNIWSVLEEETCNRVQLRLLVSMIQAIRKVALTMRNHLQWMRKNPILRPLYWLLRQPLDLPVKIGMGFLNRTMLLSCELALTYVMALTNSPFSIWIRETEASPDLMEEIKWEGQQAVQFIIDRELEAPERFSAIQTYRATMAVFKKQREFLDTLMNSGVLNSTEHSIMMHPIDEVERRLEAKGPTWRAPVVKEVLGNLPFLRGQPREVLELFLRNGRLTMYDNGSDIKSKGHICIVVSGLVKVTYHVMGKSSPEYFLGTGGMFGIWGALTGASSPWRIEAVAAGNAVGKGPVMFVVGTTAVGLVRQLASMGDPVYMRVEQDMFRLAALYGVDRLKHQLMETWADMATQSSVLQELNEAELEEMLGDTEGMLPDAGYLRLVLGRRLAAEMLNEMKEEITHGILVQLKPGQYILQRFHFCLISGSLSPAPLIPSSTVRVNATYEPKDPKPPTPTTLPRVSPIPPRLAADGAGTSSSGDGDGDSPRIYDLDAASSQDSAEPGSLPSVTPPPLPPKAEVSPPTPAPTPVTATIPQHSADTGVEALVTADKEIGETWVPPRLQPWLHHALEKAQLISSREADDAPAVRLVAGANGAVLLCCTEHVEVLGGSSDDCAELEVKDAGRPMFARGSVSRKVSRRTSTLGLPQRTTSDGNDMSTCTSNFGHGLTSSFADQMQDVSSRPAVSRQSTDLPPMQGSFWLRHGDSGDKSHRGDKSQKGRKV